MTAPVLKTKAEQKLEYLTSLKRPLSPSESNQLYRSMHAVYVRDRRLSVIEMQRDEELKLLEVLRAESRMPEWS